MDQHSREEVRRDLAYLFDKASQALAARMAAALAEVQMTPRDYCVLSRAMTGELTQGELAELALLDKTTMVVTLDHLERAGLARRIPCPTDRRARIVETTETGRTAVAKAQAVIDGLYEEILGTLPDGQREALLDALVHLVTSGGPLAAIEPTAHAPRRRPARSSRQG